MIVVLASDDERGVADSISADLDRAYRSQLIIVLESASSPGAWSEEPSWDDLIIVLYSHPELPAGAREFIAEFVRRRGERALVLPVNLESTVTRPPAPIAGIKAIEYNDSARGLEGRIVRRVGAMLGLKLRRHDNQILISYRARDGTDIATQLHDHLTSLSYRAWLDEAEDPTDGQANILPGEDIQTKIRRALSESNLLLLVDTPAAGESGWIKYEIDTANADLLPVLPVCLRPSGDHRKGPQFRSLRDLQRWIDIPLPERGELLRTTELDSIVDELESYLSEIFRRKCRVPFIVEREFISREFAWRHLDKRLFIYESSRRTNPRVALKVLSHCSFFDQVYVPALKRVLEYLQGIHGVNYSLYVYDGELIPEPLLRELLDQSDIKGIDTLIVLHHQELAALIDSNFTALPQ